MRARALFGALAVGITLGAHVQADGGAPMDAGAGGQAHAEAGGQAQADAEVPADAGTDTDAEAGAPAQADAGAPAAATPADAGPSYSCTEQVPAGKRRPKISAKLPRRGLSGHAAVLEVVVEHGKGEQVLPNGFRVHLDSDEAKDLERAGFALPDPDGGAGPSVTVDTTGETAKTTVRIPFVPLPEEAGRHDMVLPPMPIAVARASGELVTVCTEPLPIVVDDPTANTIEPKPRPNPPPRPQREVWTTAKNVAIAALVALVVGALAAWLIGRWLKRPKPAPPPAPPRPPWEVALEELFDIRHAGLVDDERFAELFDRVSDTVRKYLGERYGFDGLESTTREVLTMLRLHKPAIEVLPEIEAFLKEADLVKFARLTPSEQECESTLEAGEDIVRRTIPAMVEVHSPAAAAEGRPE